MASYRKQKTSRGTTVWQAVWREPVPGGKLKQRTKNFASEKEARNHAQRQEQEIERRGVGDPQKHNVERYFKRWLAYLTERGEHSPSTLSSYRRHSTMASVHIGHIQLEKLAPGDLDDMYTVLLRRGGKTHKVGADGKRGERPLAARTVLHVHRTLNTGLEQARKWKLISENPAKDATAPTPAKRPVKSFTEDEVARLMTAAEPDRETYIILATLLITGVRRSELLGLAMDALDLDAGTLEIKRVVLEVDHQTLLRDVPKTDSSARTLNIPPLLVDLLREQKARTLKAALTWGKGYRTEPRFLFARPDGEPIDPLNGMTVRLRQVMRRAGIAGRPPTHGWRHTAATVLIGLKTDITTIQTRLGHSSPVITMALYSDPVSERDQAAGEHLADLMTRGKKP